MWTGSARQLEDTNPSCHHSALPQLWNLGQISLSLSFIPKYCKFLLISKTLGHIDIATQFVASGCLIHSLKQMCKGAGLSWGGVAELGVGVPVKRGVGGRMLTEFLPGFSQEVISKQNKANLCSRDVEKLPSTTGGEAVKPHPSGVNPDPCEPQFPECLGQRGQVR